MMQIGRKTKVPTEWCLGEKRIKNTSSYRYLGDEVTNNNKNKPNLEIRENKIYATVRQINTTASSDIMRGVEARVLLILYERSIIPSLINNCESWTLTISEEDQLDRVGIRALKRLFCLPTTTPNSSIIYSLGQLYVTQEVDKKRFMFLHKVLSREASHWTNKMLLHLKNHDLGWAKNIQEKLTQYNIETDWIKIKSMTKNEWRKNVNDATEKFNMEKLLKSCISPTPHGDKIKTKTKHVHQQLTSTNTKERRPSKGVISGSKQRAKTLILSRYHMLECGSNFKGTMSQTCPTCKTTDNEQHRLKECSVYNDLNHLNNVTNCTFEDVYSDETEILNPILTHIEKVWEFRYANGRMKKL